MKHNALPDGERVDVEEQGLGKGDCCQELAIGTECKVFKSTTIIFKYLLYGALWGGCWGCIGDGRLNRNHRGDGGQGMVTRGCGRAWENAGRGNRCLDYTERSPG